MSKSLKPADENSSAPGAKGLEYYKKWNSFDFNGKYHIRNFKEKVVPVAGTQIKKDFEHIAEKSKDVDQFNSFIEKTEENCAQRTKIRKDLAKVSTRVAFSTTIGEPVKELEEIQREKAREVNRNNQRAVDSEEDIKKFLKYIRLGRAHYVGYACSLGFRSINAVDESTGNTALHYAVQKGDVQCVEELLKYRAIPEIKNRLGNTPVHDAWIFWNNDRYKAKEVRIEQEKKTIDILRLLFSYNCFVDAQDQNGNTPLHIAARLGPFKAALLILGFKAKHTILNYARESPSDIAQKFKNADVLKILKFWPTFARAIVKSDFEIVWGKFISNNQAVISENLSAEDVIFQLTMASNLKKINRLKNEHDAAQDAEAKEGEVPKTTGLVPIDDALWRKTYVEGKNNEEIPKPWEAEWEFYVDERHGQGIVSPWEPPVDMKKTRNKLAALVEKKNKAKRAMELKGRFPDRQTPARIATALEEVRLTKLQKLKSHSHSQDGGDVSNGMGERVGSLGEGITDETTGVVFDSTKQLGNDNTAVDNNPRDNAGNGNIQEMSCSNPQELKSDIVLNKPGSSQNPSTISRPPTNAQQRRVVIAEKVARDGKFIGFTKRPATSSSLWLPLRKPEAPCSGTDEQGDILRIIASQGKDFELVAKTKTVSVYEKLGLQDRPTTSSIGAYCEAIKYGGASDRDKYLHSLTGTHTESGDLVDPRDTAKKDMLDGVATREALKTNTVDMVGNRRRRFVDKALMPPKHLNTYLEEAHERERKEEQRKKELIDEKNKTLVRNGAPVVTSSMDVAEQLAERMKFLKPIEVHYGKGRLRSTHNLKGKIVEPWTTVQHNYATKIGDRTS